MINEGYSKDFIVEAVSSQFNCTPRSIYDQYRNILNSMISLASEDREQLRATLMLRNDEIYRKAVTERKFKTALDANLAQAKLGGLFNETAEKSKQPEFIEITERPPLKVVGDGSES